MNCTEDKLKNDLVELYTYYFKRSAQARHGNTPLLAYETGKNDGAVEALGAIMLQVFGGRRMYEIWQKTMEWANKE